MSDVADTAAQDMRTRSLAALSSSVDGMRGIAAILMIINHIGARLLDVSLRYEGVVGLAVFLGSAAPVLFFFLTGFGTGMREVRTTNQRSLSLDKIMLLFIADWFLVWPSSRTWGMDFFGFIAITTLCTNMISGLRRPIAWCLGLSALLLVLRFGISTNVAAWTDIHPMLVWLAGVLPIDGISYPLAPWLVYGLIGLAAGRFITSLYRRSTESTDPTRKLIIFLASTSAALAIIGVIAWRSGMIIHRWGSVSITFFILSLAILSGGSAIALLMQRHIPKVLSSISLYGVAALLVVPVHYLFISILAVTGFKPLGAIAYGIVCVGVLFAAIGASKLIGTGVASVRSSSTQKIIAIALCAVALAAIWWNTSSSDVQRTLWSSLGMLGVAFWLQSAVRPRRTTAG